MHFKRISCKQIWGFFFSVGCSWIEMIVCETVFNSWKQVSLSWQRILQHFTMFLAHEENICLWCFLLIKRCFCKNTILLLVNKNVFIQSHVKKQIYDQTFFLMAKQNCRWKTNYVKKKDSHCCWLVKKQTGHTQTRLSSLEVFSDDLLMSLQKDDIQKKLFKFSAADSVSFARDRETLSEAESEPINSSLSFGDGNMETSSAAARHADVTPQSRTTTSLRTTTPREPTPPGLRGSSEEGERLWGNCLTLFLFCSVNITYKQRYNPHESRNMIFYYLNKNRTKFD